MLSIAKFPLQSAFHNLKEVSGPSLGIGGSRSVFRVRALPISALSAVRSKDLSRSHCHCNNNNRYRNNDNNNDGSDNNNDSNDNSG